MATKAEVIAALASYIDAEARWLYDLYGHLRLRAPEELRRLAEDGVMAVLAAGGCPPAYLLEIKQAGQEPKEDAR